MYYKFKDSDGNEFGSFEVFESSQSAGYVEDEDGAPMADGFYWWACFPGCLPDGDPSGPFASEEEAINDANEES